MFVIRGKNGEIMVSSDLKTAGKEVQYKTKQEAEKALQQFELSLPKGMFSVKEISDLFICERCESSEDVAVVYINDEPKSYCQKCRVEMFSKKKPIGRPALGITKKVSLTLSEEDWEWLDEKANGNRSNFIRRIVTNALGNESEWDNYACLGYAIKGAEKLGYSHDEIKKLVRAIYSQFDMTTVPEANKIYRESEY